MYYGWDFSGSILLFCMEREREREREGGGGWVERVEKGREIVCDSLNVIFYYTGIDCDVKSNSVRHIEMESLTGRSSSIHLSMFVARMYERWII